VGGGSLLREGGKKAGVVVIGSRGRTGWEEEWEEGVGVGSEVWMDAG
jgi:hypothetical protein